jgi:hypothetical protein
MTPEAFWHQLRVARERDAGCSLCGLERYQARRYLEGIASDGVNDPPLRDRLVRQGGYCVRHSREFVALSLLLPSAILLEDVVGYRLRHARQGKRANKLHCAACEVEHKVRTAIAKSVRRHRHEAVLHELLLAGTLCLPHLELVCPELPEPVRQKLIDAHQGLLHDLAEVIRKHDYRFTHEPISAAESASVKAALALLGEDS